jgi:hypothetical protein
MAHRVRLHHWINGLLRFEDHLFERIEEAMGFAQSTDAHSAKVYTDDIIVHQVQTAPQAETYA